MSGCLFVSLCVCLYVCLYVSLFCLVEALISNDPVSETGSKFQAVDILCVPDSVDDESSSLYNFIIQVSV